MKWRIIFFILFFSTLAWAQVNVEPLRARLDESGFGAEAAASLATKGGNKQKLEFGGDLLVGGKYGPHLAYINGAISYERYHGEVEEEESFVHARYNLELVSWFWWEAFAQRVTDEFRYATRQDLLGTGPRVGSRGEAFSVFYGTSYMAEWLLLPEESDTPQLFHRWNNYASTMYRHENVTASLTVYFQPRFDAFEDYYLLAVPSVRFGITDVLSSSVSGEVYYVSVPFPGEGPWDYAVSNSLEVSF
jgi:hypothetical protein